MIFTKNSGLVKIWAGNIQLELYALDQVPQLFNLKEVVTEVIQESVK